jgi:Transposase DDE domain
LVTSSSLKDWRDGTSAVGHRVRGESLGAIEWWRNRRVGHSPYSEIRLFLSKATERSTSYPHQTVFGQIKQARGFRQFLLRGVANVRAEWAIVCTVHNLLKLAAAAKLAQRWTLSAALPPALAAP